MKKFSLTIVALLMALCAMAQARFWVYNIDGTQSEFLISEFDSITFTNPMEEKCKASDYPQVTIGTQTWMAENYRCSKYDTESEAYDAVWLINNTIPTSESHIYTPYYTDAADKYNWTNDSQTRTGLDLSYADIAKLGYLYNWAAAVGVEDGEKQTTIFSGKRQGICPNGWHLPSKADWDALAKAVGGGTPETKPDGTISYSGVGTKLKSKSGWFLYKPSNDYGFSALPAGYSDGNHINMVGQVAEFWTADAYSSDHAWNIFFFYQTGIMDFISDYKLFGEGVRCLKD